MRRLLNYARQFMNRRSGAPGSLASALVTVVAAGSLLWGQPASASDSFCRFLGIGHSVGYHAYDCCPGYCQPKFGVGSRLCAGHGPGCCPTGGCPACQGGNSAGDGDGQMFYEEARRRPMVPQPALASRPRPKAQTARSINPHGIAAGYGAPPRAAMAVAPNARRPVQNVTVEQRGDQNRIITRFDSRRIREDATASNRVADEHFRQGHPMVPQAPGTPASARRTFNAVVTAVPTAH